MDHMLGTHPTRTNYEAMRSSDLNVHNMKNADILQVISRRSEDESGPAEDDAERQIYNTELSMNMKSTAVVSGETAARRTEQFPEHYDMTEGTLGDVSDISRRTNYYEDNSDELDDEERSPRIREMSSEAL